MKVFVMMTFILLILASVFFHTGNGIRCYECHSATDRDCSERNPNLRDYWKKDCGSGFCSKTVVHETGSTERGCFPYSIQRVTGCIFTSGVEMCAYPCETDLCNGKESVKGSRVLLTATTLALPIYLIKFGIFG